jgi:hypothetical protein
LVSGSEVGFIADHCDYCVLSAHVNAKPLLRVHEFLTFDLIHSSIKPFIKYVQYDVAKLDATLLPHMVSHHEFLL